MSVVEIGVIEEVQEISEERMRQEVSRLRSRQRQFEQEAQRCRMDADDLSYAIDYVGGDQAREVFKRVTTKSDRLADMRGIEKRLRDRARMVENAVKQHSELKNSLQEYAAKNPYMVSEIQRRANLVLQAEGNIGFRESEYSSACSDFKELMASLKAEHDGKLSIVKSERDEIFADIKELEKVFNSVEPETTKAVEGAIKSVELIGG